MIRPVMTFFALALSFFYLQAYWVVRERYSDAPVLAMEVEFLKEKVRREEFRQVLLSEQSQSFRQEVARILPDALKSVGQSEAGYPLRNIASVVRTAKSENMQTLVASTLFETGRTLFRKGEYARANRIFRKLISEYGYATQVVEAHFLNAEGEYLMGNLEGATEIINQMVELFPDSELTGFALIRMGQIFENRERYDEALQLYRTILRTFPYRNVASAAQKSLGRMEP